MKSPRSILTACALALWLSACGLAGGLESMPPTSALERAQARAQRDRGIELLSGQGRLAEAAEAFELAVRSDPADPFSRQWAAWCAELRGDDDLAFEHSLQAARLDHPTAEPAIWSAHRLATTRGQTERLAQALAAVVGAAHADPATQARAGLFLGHCLRALGRFEQAARTFQRLGTLGDWMLAGPFDNDQNAGFQTAYEPEQGIADLSQTYPGKLRRVGWRRAVAFSPDGRISLRAMLDPSRHTTAYLVTWIHSPNSQAVALRLAAFRGVKLWLNDRELLSDDQARLPAFDQYVVGGTLQAGWNKLLVKVCQRDGPWQLGLRLTDLRGRSIEGLRFDTALHGHPDQRLDRSPLPKPESFAAWLDQAPADDLRAVLQTRWSLNQGFSQQAVESATARVAARPNCPLARWLLAEAHFQAGHASSALKALAEAERLSPGLPRALLDRAEWEQRQKRPERAMQILKPLLAARPGLPSVEARSISLLKARGWDLDALRAAERFAKARPDSDWVWRAIGETHFALLQLPAGMAAFRRALELRADHKPTYDELISRELLLGRMDRALALLGQRTQVFPDQISAALQTGRYLLAGGRSEAALEVCERIERIAPDYWYLHKLRGDIFKQQGADDRALAAYTRSLDCAPDNPGLREYIDHLTDRQDEVFMRYGLPPEQVERWLVAPDTAEIDSQADAVFLLDDMVTHVFEDGSAAHLVHQAYLILNENGQRRFSKFRVPASASLRLQVAETIQPDGTRQEATSIRRGEIHMPALQAGSILNVAYRYDSASSSWMEDHFADSFHFQGSFPTRRARWVLALPAGKRLHVLRRPETIGQQIEQLGGLQVFVWEAEQIPMLHPEPGRPPDRELGAAVFVSTVPDIQTLARWQNSLIQDQFEIDEEVRAKTTELTRGATTPRERLEAIHAFVAKEIRYLNHDVGIFGKKPDQAVNVFANRFGDCKDKSTLMIAMLRQVGIEAHYAAIRTRDRGPVFWEVPYAQTNHIITYLPAQAGFEQPVFIDPTYQFGHVEALPERDQGVVALVLDGQGHRLLTTPESGPHSAVDRVQLAASLLGADGLRIEVQESWTGWYAAHQRARLHTAGKRREEFEKALNRRYPGAQLEQVELEGLDDLSATVSARYSLAVPGWVRRDGDQLRFKALWPLQATRTFASIPQRRYDLIQLWLSSNQDTIALELPPGYRMARLPEPLRIDADGLRYESACKLGSGQVVCRRSFELTDRRIDRERYAQFRKRCMQIDQAEEQELILVPARPGS